MNRERRPSNSSIRTTGFFTEQNCAPVEHPILRSGRIYTTSSRGVAILQRFRIERTGQFSFHVVKDVIDRVIGKAFEAGIRRPAQVWCQNDVVELEQRMILGQWLVHEKN